MRASFLTKEEIWKASPLGRGGNEVAGDDIFRSMPPLTRLTSGPLPEGEPFGNHRKLREIDLAVLPDMEAQKTTIGGHKDAGTARFLIDIFFSLLCNFLFLSFFHRFVNNTKKDTGIFFTDQRTKFLLQRMERGRSPFLLLLVLPTARKEVSPRKTP